VELVSTRLLFYRVKISIQILVLSVTCPNGQYAEENGIQTVATKQYSYAFNTFQTYRYSKHFLHNTVTLRVSFKRISLQISYTIDLNQLTLFANKSLQCK
jgi:hypothetical protein